MIFFCCPCTYLNLYYKNYITNNDNNDTDFSETMSKKVIDVN